jgi:uncharacterized membrane protein
MTMAGFHVVANADGVLIDPEVRRIGVSDVFDALKRGVDDFRAKPSHILFLGIIYPIVGVFLASWTSGANAFPLLFPLMSGFALLGPVAALGLYEISRRREAGLDTSWKRALEVRHSPALPSIIAVGVFLFAVFITWLLVAQSLYDRLFPSVMHASLADFIREVLMTSHGWMLIIFGNAIGLLFAFIVLTTTVIAFPLLVDRDVGALSAMRTSARAVLANPVPMLAWGLIVALALAIGSIPLFAGLAVVMPILGHATWHLYRKVVEPPASTRRA